MFIDTNGGLPDLRILKGLEKVYTTRIFKR